MDIEDLKEKKDEDSKKTLMNAVSKLAGNLIAILIVLLQVSMILGFIYLILFIFSSMIHLWV
jgi:hypothetical protein